MEAITYAEFVARMRREWEPGQHIAIVGPTGSGKTYIARDLLALRKYAIVLATKSRDKTLEEYRFDRFDRWPVEYDARAVLLWKKAKRLGDFSQQRLLIYRVLDDVYRTGGWSIYFDDLFYISETLALKRAIQMLYTQVRSQGVSLIASMQRPRWVPLEAVSQVSYLICFRIHDEIDAERIAGGMGINRKELLAAMKELQQYEFMVIQSNGTAVRVMKRD